MKKIFIFVLACYVIRLCSGVSIRYSGALGQSAPEGAPVLRFTGVGALAEGNEIFFADGAKIFVLGENNSVTQVAAIPGGHAVKQIQFDGIDCYVYASDGAIYRIAGNHCLDRVVTLPREYRNIAVVANSLKCGIGAKAKFIAIEERTVVGWNARAESVGKLFTLPETKGNAPFVTIGVLPDSGDVVVGAYYPDCTLFRLTADGREVVEKGWPYLRHEQYGMQQSGKRLFGFGTDGVTEIKDNMSIRGIAVGDVIYDRGIKGIAQNKNGYFLGTTQGIKFYPNANPQEAAYRIGGLTDVTGLSILDGRILCATKNGMTVRLLADDLNDEILSCNGDGIWRINGNWTEQIAGVASGCGAYIVLGRKLGVWKNFTEEPRHLRWSKCESNTEFSKPQAIAATETDIYVVDDGRIFHSPDSSKLVFAPVLSEIVSGVKCIAAQGTKVAFSTENELCMTDNGKIKWKVQCLSGISGIAFAGDFIVAAQHGKVTCFALCDGKQVAQIDAVNVPRGFVAGAVAGCGSWIYVYDNANARIIRFVLRKESQE